MKLKITSFHLIFVILIQIILIDMVLFVFLLNALNKGHKTIKPPLEGQASLLQKVNGDKKTSKGDTSIRLEAAGTGLLLKSINKIIRPDKESLSETSGESGIASSAFKGHSMLQQNDMLIGLFQKVAFRKQKGRDLKIMDIWSSSCFDEMDFIATAYDLSYECSGKHPWHPAYGITFSGKRAEKGRTIAVDPEVIPLGSQVYIEFPKPYSNMNGWYVAEDTGSKVKGRIIDVFFGETTMEEMKKFGRREVKVKIIYPSNYNAGIK